MSKVEISISSMSDNALRAEYRALTEDYIVHDEYSEELTNALEKEILERAKEKFHIKLMKDFLQGRL